MKKTLLVIMVVLVGVVMLAGCPPVARPSNYVQTGVEKPPTGDKPIYIYVFNADGKLRNRYVAGEGHISYGNQVPKVDWYLPNGYIQTVYSDNMEISPGPIELYEEQYRKFTPPASTKIKQ